MCNLLLFLYISNIASYGNLNSIWYLSIYKNPFNLIQIFSNNKIWNLNQQQVLYSYLKKVRLRSYPSTHIKIKRGKKGKIPTFPTFHYHPHRYRAFQRRQGKINFNDTWTEIPTAYNDHNDHIPGVTSQTFSPLRTCEQT